MQRYGSALSEHPDATQAVGEIVGRILDLVGPAPDMAVVFVSEEHRESFGEITGAIRTMLSPQVLIGCTTASLMVDDLEVEDRAAISLWAGNTGPVAPVRIHVDRSEHGVSVGGFEEVVDAGDGTLVLLGDPFSMPTTGLLRRLAETVPDLVVVGGLAGAGHGAGANRFVLDDLVVSDGAVGALFPPGVIEPIVSQGCRPIGSPAIVTAAEGNLVVELAGTKALERLEAELGRLAEDEQEQAAQGLHLGLVLDESQATFGQGDFLIRNVVGADHERGAVAIGTTVEVGQTAQFHVRDAVTSDVDLDLALRAGPHQGAALVFSCNARGSALFGPTDHDARTIHEHLGGAVAGMFCTGEIGPVGGRNHVHGFTACIAVFGDS
ncbi:MAG TPA: FIST N-terminal domain-containing protein [Acidimicrobiales bacterium]|nr:FIST N-terminal domain-containing protein [Acidimicrobiales bacterium]